MLLEVLSKQASVSVGVVSSNNDKSIEVERIYIGNRTLELFWFFYLVPSGA